MGKHNCMVCEKPLGRWDHYCPEHADEARWMLDRMQEVHNIHYPKPKPPKKEEPYTEIYVRRRSFAPHSR